MQTNFTLAQLADPATAESEAILRKCVHCGFCTATCPTYVTLGNELDSPRGRIYLIKDMLENDRPADAEVTLHIDRCLSCLSCMTTCPSGVDYMHLVDHARVHIEKTHRRPPMRRLARSLLAAVLPHRGRFRLALRAARLAKPLAPLLARVASLRPFAAMLALAPSRLPPPERLTQPGINRPIGEPRARVALLGGCAQSVLDPGINAAAIRLMTRFGVEVVMPAGEACCGALTHHMGREADALDSARAMVDLWTREIEAGGLDAIVITTSGCGTVIKDYGHMLRLDPAYAAKASRVSALARDVTEFLAELGLSSLPASGITVAYHSACSLQHGQRVISAPKMLLKNAGFTVKDPVEAHLCCGSAGTYNILESEISATLRARKVKALTATRASIVAAGNLGCMTQLAPALDMPVLHTVQLLDWAYGGDKPAGL